MATTKKQRDEIVAVIDEYLVEHAERVAQLLEEGRVRAVNGRAETRAATRPTSTCRRSLEFCASRQRGNDRQRLAEISRRSCLRT